MATDWEDAGLPCVSIEGYQVTRDIGLLYTPFWTQRNRQTGWLKDTVWTFRCNVDLDQGELKIAEDFLDSAGYDGFTIPLVSDGCLREHLVRLIDRYLIRSSSGRFQLSFAAQNKIPVYQPDLTPYPVVVPDPTCCQADDFQCCDPGP